MTGYFHLNAHAQLLCRVAGVCNALCGGGGNKHVVGLIAGDVKSKLLPAVIAVGAVIRNPYGFVAQRMDVRIEIGEQTVFVRVGRSKILLEPVKADKLKIFKTSRTVSGKLLVNYPFDGFLTVGKQAEIFRDPVFVNVSEICLSSYGVQTCQEHLYLVVVVFLSKLRLHVAYRFVERFYIVAVKENIVNERLPVGKVGGMVVVAIGPSAGPEGGQQGR